MAKKLRKQITRALKRRFHQFENQLLDVTTSKVSDTRNDLVLSYNEFADKARSAVKRLAIVAGVACIVLVVLSLVSCNLTRKVTTESSYFQKGDTSCTITVKTVESYDATKKLTN